MIVVHERSWQAVLACLALLRLVTINRSLALQVFQPTGNVTAQFTDEFLLSVQVGVNYSFSVLLHLLDLLLRFGRLRLAVAMIVL